MHSTMHLYPIDGAVHRVGQSDTAWAYRDVNFSQVIAGVDPDPANAELVKRWAVDYWDATHPYSAGGAYVNFMMDEGQERVRATYGPNYQRLTEIKGRIRSGQRVPHQPEHPARRVSDGVLLSARGASTRRAPFVITREVETSAVVDLALSPPRAALAATVDDEILVLPASVKILTSPSIPRGRRASFRCRRAARILPIATWLWSPTTGPQWFRVAFVNCQRDGQGVGRSHPIRVVPNRIVAWDYGSLRKVSTPPRTSNAPQTSFSAVDQGNDVQAFDSPELTAVLQASRVMIVASRSQKGTPFAVPLWFVTLGGRIYATTSASSWTVRNVVALAPRVAMLFGGEGRDGRSRLLEPRTCAGGPRRTAAGSRARSDSCALLPATGVRGSGAEARTAMGAATAVLPPRRGPRCIVITPQSATECGGDRRHSATTKPASIRARYCVAVQCYRAGCGG